MIRISLLLIAAIAVVASATPTGEEAKWIVDSDKPEASPYAADPWYNTTIEVKDTYLSSTEVRQSKIKENCNEYDQCSFLERFLDKDKKRWTASHDYTNGMFFASWWSKKRVGFNRKHKRVDISVGRVRRHGKEFVSGELRSHYWHGYGCYEVRMKPANQEGLVSTFFSFTGKYDAAPGNSKKHNEVDIEFLYSSQYGKIVMQTNYFSNGRGNHERDIPLPFNPTKKTHNYGFKWTSKKIVWYVDGKVVHSATKDIPKIKKGPHKIMMNMWPVSEYTGVWAGKYTWGGSKAASYSGVRFTKGEDCKIMNKFY